MLNKFNEIVNPGNKNIYLKTKNKVRCDAEVYSYEEAEKLEQTAWWIHDDYIVIDVDIKEHANILYKIIKEEKINCHIFKSIKGAHFVFRERSGFPVPQVTATYSSVGIKFDTRTTDKGYIVLPHKQSNRKWVRISSKKIDELPMWLFPQKKLTNAYIDKIVDEKTGKKTKIDIMPNFPNLAEGDSRNDTLFRFFTKMLNLKLNLTIEEKRKSIELLNNYVLQEPLKETELYATVLRDELTEDLPQDAIDHGQELDPDIVANKIIKDEDIITKTGMMYIYNDGYFKPLSEDELHYLIHHKYDKRAKDFKRNEIVKFIKVKTDIRDKDINTSPMMINVVNGRVNLQTQELEEHTETAYDTIRIPYKYNRDAKPSDLLMSFLRFISNNDKDKLSLIFEMIGLTLVKKQIMEVFFVVVGEQGGNGKSTILEIIENLLSSENVSNIDLGDIGSDEYAGYELYNKLANIGDDLKLTALKDTGLIKTLTSGKSINAKVKFKPRFKFKNFATMIYAANRLPNTYDKSGGFYRRFKIIKFNNSMPEGQRDPFLVDKLTNEDYEYLLHRSVHAVANVISRNRLTELKESTQELETYKTENSSILIFLHENGIDVEKLNLYPVRDLYHAYKDYCIDGGYKVLQKSIFDSEIHQQFGAEKKLTTKNGRGNKTRWVIEDTNEENNK